MAVITVVATVVAVGDFLVQLAGGEGLPKVVHGGVAVWQRMAPLLKTTPHARMRRALENQLASAEYLDARPWDVQAADDAVARVLASVPLDERTRAAVRSQTELRDLLAERAASERAALLAEPAQHVFDLVLNATAAYLVQAVSESPDFQALAHREELADLASLAIKLRTLQESLDRIPATTVAMLAGRTLKLDRPVTPNGTDINPSRLLAPTSGAFPFVDRGELLERLWAWVTSDEAFAVQLVGGPGGSGKSRLAVELCRRLTEHSPWWSAGFLESTPTEAVLATLAGLPRGRLIVLDYAETRVADVESVLETLADAVARDPQGWLKPVRVLLLIRNASASDTANNQPEERWRTAVRPPKNEAVQTLIDKADVATLEGGSLPPADREALFRTAVARLPRYRAAHTGEAPQPELPDLSDPVYDQPLTVAMAAFLTVAGGATAVSTRSGLFEGILEHESRYWQKYAQANDVALTLTSAEQRQIVALATLTDAADGTEADALLAGVSFLVGDANAQTRGRARGWLRKLYPNPDGLWGHLTPDRLGEYLVATELASQPKLLAAALDPERTPEQWVRPLRVLARACVDHQALADAVVALLADALEPVATSCRTSAERPDPWGAAPVIEALTMLVDAVGSRLPPEVLVRVSGLLGLGNRLLAGLCLAVDEAAAAATTGTDHPALRAHALDHYAIRLGEVGRREEALVVAGEAVDAFRGLAGERPRAFGGELARSLHNHANRLAEVGRREDALVVAGEAVGLYRGLAGERPRAFGGELARSLNNYAIRLAEVGRREDALVVAGEAVAAFRGLAGERPGVFGGELARSLNTYAALLGEVGRREDALVVAGEAVGLYRGLAGERPGAFGGELARALNNYAIRLAEVGRREDALSVAGEAVEAFRGLAGERPGVFGGDLARSLNNYANRLGEVGRREDALVVAGEAVELYRGLAGERPGVFGGDLARSLRNYAIRLAEVGRREEALSVAGEAVELYREFARHLPSAFGGSFQGALATLAWILDDLGRTDEADGVRNERDAYVRTYLPPEPEEPQHP